MCAACVCGGTGFCSGERVLGSQSICGSFTSPNCVTTTLLGGSCARSVRAASSGRRASRIARTTAIPGAPCATTSSTVSASIPPIANHGTRSASRAARTSSRPPAADSGFVGRAEDGADAEIVRIALELRRGRRREADDRVGADGPPCVGKRCVALPDVDAVGAGALDEVGAVVQHEERAVRVARAPERLGGRGRARRRRAPCRAAGRCRRRRAGPRRAARQDRGREASPRARDRASSGRASPDVRCRSRRWTLSSAVWSGIDVAIVGGGIIGLACALRAQQRGLSVCVLERGAAGGGATHAAAGVLAPDPETPGFTGARAPVGRALAGIRRRARRRRLHALRLARPRVRRLAARAATASGSTAPRAARSSRGSQPTASAGCSCARRRAGRSAPRGRRARGEARRRAADEHRRRRGDAGGRRARRRLAHRSRPGRARRRRVVVAAAREAARRCAR